MPGPLRDPNSRRGRAEVRKRQRLMATEANFVKDNRPLPVASADLPVCDPKLPRRIREIYLNLVIDLGAAKVPIKQADAHAITMAARCLYAVEEAERIAGDGDLPADQRMQALRLVAQQGKDLQRWLELICATPGSRARIGLKTETKKAPGPLAQLLAAKQGRTG